MIITADEESNKMVTSQIMPLWKFFDGHILIQSERSQKITFKEASWEQSSEIYYLQSDTAEYSFKPSTGELKKFR